MQRWPGPARAGQTLFEPFRSVGVRAARPAAKAQHANALAPRKAALNRNLDCLLLPTAAVRQVRACGRSFAYNAWNYEAANANHLVVNVPRVDAERKKT